jgi:hypothetical protein
MQNVDNRDLGKDIDPDDEPMKTVAEHFPEQELDVLVESLRLTRIARAGDEGTYAAKKALFETENQKLTDSINLSKAAEVTLTNKIRYLALKAHAESGKKKFAGDKVTIKMFKETEIIYEVDQVMSWARKQAPALILEVLDKPTFWAMVETKGSIIDPATKECIAQAQVKQEPRAQISTSL